MIVSPEAEQRTTCRFENNPGLNDGQRTPGCKGLVCEVAHQPAAFSAGMSNDIPDLISD